MVEEPIAIWPLWALTAIVLMGSMAIDFDRFLQALSREGPVSLVLDHFPNLVRLTVIHRQEHFILLSAGIRNTLKTTLAILRICFSMALHSTHRCMEHLVLLVLDQVPCILMDPSRLNRYKEALFIPARSMVFKHHRCMVLLVPVCHL